MAAQTSFFLVEEELSCPICFEEYNLSEKNRQPKLLLCLHTFCLACMESLRKYDGTLQCSICRTSHHVYRTCELMDNYVIFEYLRTKQEFEDGKLAAHLKQEYEESVKALKEQEERDAQLARQEDEKHKQEIERLREEEEKRRQEVERQELERINLEQRLEEERRLEGIREQQEEEERRRLEQERNNEAPYLQIRVSHTPNDSSEERESSSDSNDSRNDDESLDSDTDDDSFQDLESAQTDDDDSPTSLVDPDDYETLSSDMDRYSTEVISSESDPEDDVERGRPSATLPIPSISESDQTNHEKSHSTSPEPNLLSEEFSGVSQVKNAPQDTLSSLLPAVKCSERSDGSIIIIDDSTDERTSDDETNQQDTHHRMIKECTLDGVSSSQNSESDKENNPSKRYSSSEDECQVRRTGNEIEQNKIKSLHLQMEDENCKLQ